MNMYNALVYMVIARFMISVAKLRLFFESSIGCLWKIRNRNKNENSCKSVNYETAGSAPYGKITSPPAFSVHKSGKRSSLCVIWAFVLYLLNPKTVKSLHGNDIILHTLTLAFNIVTTQFTTLAPASETGNNIFIPALQIRLKIVTFASASK